MRPQSRPNTLPLAGLAAALLTLSAAAALACGGNPTCTVKDPTGTPLNIRLGPNETIVGTAANGTQLSFIDHQEHNGKLWARVAHFDVATEPLDWGEGYLFAAYLECDQEITEGAYSEEFLCRVQDPTGTPLNIRAEPGGEILGSIRNGETVRVFGGDRRDGKLWARAWRDPSDNAIGWVFDDYLQCEEDEAH
ncbi:MAG: SH3 domain-containing protein [Nitratireductor sp.]|nr:SH3 domain-containing protein [Nitratireductor sp.]